MLKQKIIRGLSATTLQLVINQLFGVVIFYILSRELTKNNFGELNWTLAVLLTAFNLLSFGIDQILVKKIAAGGNISTLLSLYVLHTIITGLLFYGLLFLASLIFPEFFVHHNLLLLIGIGKLLLFFSTPFKQLVTGLQKYNWLLYMSVCSSVLRGLVLLFISLHGNTNIETVVIIFIAGDALELLVCFIINKKIVKPGKFYKWNRQEYLLLLRESLPQVGVVIFTSTIARFDWIFIGLFVSDVKLAEYSFAYKIFEITTLPLLAIAPLLVPFFTIFFQQKKENNFVSVQNVKFLLRMEMVIAALTALLLNLLWIPLIDQVTQGKYGAVNIHTIFILSLCIPVLYLNNFLWSIHFAIGKLKSIFFIFAITFSINILGDVILIPFYKNEGAAVAFIIAVFIQYILYLRITDFPWLKNCWQPLLLCSFSALISGISSRYFFWSDWMVISFAVATYFLFLTATFQLRWTDFKEIKMVFKQ
jgi:O-antigen/teichoic acid export membrane protein